MTWLKAIWWYFKRQRISKKSFSQCGEDIIIDYIFQLRGIKRPRYIDIGANHPYRFSNTAYFYHKGSRGINIDADPDLIKLFKILRPGDMNLNVGIHSDEGEMDFYVMQDRTLSTFSKEEYEVLQNNGKRLKEIKKVRITTVHSIIENHFAGKFPEFLSLDVEGLDMEILASINFDKYFPLVVCVEAATYSLHGSGTRRGDIIGFLSDKGYYEYANTNLNAIMVKREFWFKH